MKYLKIYQPFSLECGETLHEIDLAFTTQGTLNAQRDNVIWICHALTANADPSDWWSGLVGEGKLFDPGKYYIICANILGSCYGATNANSRNPATGQRYGCNFPIITIRDIVKSHRLLQETLGIQKIKLGIGGSMGGQQLLEWAIQDPSLFENLCVLATNAQHSPWGIAFNEAQRMALEADLTLYADSTEAGKKGLEAARAMALLSYRNYETFNRTQRDDSEALEGFRATTYERYQGTKLSNRFTALAYRSLTKSMDSHNVGRGRGGVARALSLITAKTLVIGIQSDILFPIEEQKILADYIPKSTYKVIDSPYGHDGFLIENGAITRAINDFLTNKKSLRAVSLNMPMRLAACN